jgi:hypothetical protein
MPRQARIDLPGNSSGQVRHLDISMAENRNVEPELTAFPIATPNFSFLLAALTQLNSWNPCLGSVFSLQFTTMRALTKRRPAQRIKNLTATLPWGRARGRDTPRHVEGRRSVLALSAYSLPRALPPGVAEGYLFPCEATRTRRPHHPGSSPPSAGPPEGFWQPAPLSTDIFQ